MWKNLEGIPSVRSKAEWKVVDFYSFLMELFRLQKKPLHLVWSLPSEIAL